jgi:hypothetical protein
VCLCVFFTHTHTSPLYVKLTRGETGAPVTGR